MTTTYQRALRRDRLEAVDPASETLVRRLVPLAARGLATAFDKAEGGSFPQTMRGHRSAQGPTLVAEGVSARYTAIALLGLGRLPEEEQRDVLAGGLVRELMPRVVSLATADGDPGALALAAWTTAEITGTSNASLTGALATMLRSERPLPTVDVAWMLTAALLCASADDTEEIVQRARTRLLAAQGSDGIFPHRLPASTQVRYRRHVGCFADQVYPLQALARLHAAHGDPDALAAAEVVADRICHLQGEAGQWWWFYDVRNGELVERFPVYSVHQHAMAPMALFDLRDAGGADHSDSIARGLSWLHAHPEVFGDLVNDGLSVIWRKVGRREPPKLSRGLAAATTSLRPGLRVPGVDRLMPPALIDHECRPYELGWLLYAWLTARPSGKNVQPQ